MWKHTAPLGGGGGRGEEWSGEERDSSELWGEGCDHSVIENYCHNAHARTHTQQSTHGDEWTNVYKHITRRNADV